MPNANELWNYGSGTDPYGQTFEDIYGEPWKPGFNGNGGGNGGGYAPGNNTPIKFGVIALGLFIIWMIMR